MLNTITTHFVGLDVHQATIAIAVADPGRGDPRVMPTIPNDFKTLMKSLKRLGNLDHLVCCYEAGPTGYGLYRQFKKAGVRCIVIAPSLVPVKSGQRIKTDRRDAAKLAGYLRSGDLTPIHVPDEATEAVRDLERARDDAKRARAGCPPSPVQVPVAAGSHLQGRDQVGEAARGLDRRPNLRAPGQPARLRRLPRGRGASHGSCRSADIAACAR